MPKTSEISANAQRAHIQRLSNAVARLAKKTLPLRKQKAKLDCDYDMAWEYRDMKRVGTLAGELATVMRKLNPLTKRLTRLEEKIRSLQRRLTGN